MACTVVFSALMVVCLRYNDGYDLATFRRGEGAVMCDEWMPAIKLRISMDEFRQLPRNPAYKYEYFDGHAHLSPRPKFHHARLDLAKFLDTHLAESLERHQLRHFRDDDLEAMTGTFAGAFQQSLPFGGLNDDERRKASYASLLKTLVGGDGPWLSQASFIAESAYGPSGGILVTLLPGGDPEDSSSYHWSEPTMQPAPGEAQPHLTWIFVNPGFRAEGVGTALLQQTAAALREAGYRELWSTFIEGNSSSTFWHWSCGFELLAGPLSKRAMRRRWEQIRGGLEQAKES
jgi:GNAT superfamily N-acetyltransferase